MVEQLGSGVPRILKAYPKECFSFGDSFVRINLPKTVVESNQASNQVSNQVEGMKFSISSEELVKRITTPIQLELTEDKVVKYLEEVEALSMEQVKILEYLFSFLSRRE